MKATGRDISIGVVLAILGFYLSSYISMLWLNTQVAGFLAQPDPAARVSLTVALLFVCAALTFVAGRLGRLRTIFTLVLAVLLLTSIALGLTQLDEPIADGTTSWAAVSHVFANAGRNPITLALLSCVIVQGLLAMRTGRDASQQTNDRQ